MTGSPSWSPLAGLQQGVDHHPEAGPATQRNQDANRAERDQPEQARAHQHPPASLSGHISLSDSRAASSVLSKAPDASMETQPSSRPMSYADCVRAIMTSASDASLVRRSEEHTSDLQTLMHI